MGDVAWMGDAMAEGGAVLLPLLMMLSYAGGLLGEGARHEPCTYVSKHVSME
jgi:hypothetical protein